MASNELSVQFEKFRHLLPQVSSEEIGRYEAHFSLLREWNEMIALVSRKSIGDSFYNHYADSLWINDTANRFRKDLPVVELGSGAGFPGTLFAIRYPTVPITLYEKVGKKRRFLEESVRALSLSNASVGESFPERLASPALCLARAVMPPEELFVFCRKRLPQGSVLVGSYGGLGRKVELPEGWRLDHTSRYELPDGKGERVIEIYTRVPRGT